MIGTRPFDLICEFYIKMLGLVWMLVDTVYHIIRPLESPKQNTKNKSTAGECDLKNPFDRKFNEFNVNESQVKSQSEKKTSTGFICQKIIEERLGVNPDIDFLSKQKLISATQDISLEISLELKRPSENICVLPSDILCSSYGKSCNLIAIKKSLNTKNELKLMNNLLFSLREMDEFMNKFVSADGRENPLVPIRYCTKANRKDIILDLSLQNLETDLELKRRKSNWSSVLPPQKTSHSKLIKLDYDEILTLQQTAYYVTNHLNIEAKSHLKRKYEEMENLDYFYIKEDYSDLIIKQTKNGKESNIIITELDSTDESEMANIHKNQRKNKNKKKNMKNKLNNHKIESNSIALSSKQCFEQLAFFMKTNQGLTHSKMMLEIEKEFKPIKDQICELRESMTDFVVVSHRNNDKRVKYSRLPVKPERSGPKLKSILTLSSASLQKLARLADTSVSSQENSYLKTIDGDPKKLSHLAEMYIKLSRQ